MKRIVLAVVGAVVLATSGVVAQEAKLVDAGKKLYADNGCAKCHQIDGQGARLSVLDGVGTKLTADEIRLWLTNPTEAAAKLPKKPMVPMPKTDFEDPDLDALVAYMQSLKKT